MAEAADSKEKQEDTPDYDKASYWCEKAKHTGKEFEKRIFRAARAAWAEYQLADSMESGSEEGTGARTANTVKLFNIYNSSVKTLAPAYYSKTPIPVSKTRFGLGDADARTAARLQENTAIYSLEITPFDEVMYDATLEHINSDFAVTRVMLEGERAKRQVPLMPTPDGQYALQSGQPYTGEGIAQDEAGNAYGEEEYWENLKCYPVCVPMGDVMWTPEAKSFNDFEEMYYRFCYPEEQAYKEFPEVDKDKLRGAMKTYSRSGTKEEHKDNKHKGEGKELFLHGWEIWHKASKQVRFINPNIKDEFLKTSPDTYGLRNFYPSPSPIVGTKQHKSMFGRPGYVYVADLCDQMHELAQRIHRLSNSLRRRFAVDASLKTKLSDLIENANESEYMFIEGLMQLVEKGGLSNAIQALPVGDLSQALQELANLHQMYKQEFYEIYGVPDVIRGASDPIETAKAQEIKSFSATNRFRFQMNQIARLARDTLELLVDLKFGAYSQDQIAKICGVKYWDQADQMRFPQAYMLCMSDEERFIRLDLETDSTSYINEQINQQNMNVAIQTVTGGLQALNGMPPLQQAVGFKTIQAALSGLRMGKDFQDDIDGLMKQMLEQAANPPPPPPDYEMMKVQVAQAKQQGDMQIASQKLQKDFFELQMKQQSEGATNAIKQLEAQLKAQAQAFFEWTEKIRLQYEGEGIQIDKLSFQLGAEESFMEEERLSREVDAKTIAALKPEPQPAAPAPSANITLVNQAAEPLVVPIPEPVPVLPFL